MYFVVLLKSQLHKSLREENGVDRTPGPSARSGPRQWDLETYQFFITR